MAPGVPRAERLRARRRGLGPVLALILAGCAPLSSGDGCSLPGGRPMLLATLFLGTEVPGRGPVSAQEWEEFAATVVTPRFPEGFTVLDGQGQWRDPASGRILREKTKILIIGAADTPATPQRLDEISAEWRGRFGQHSVGRVTRPACGGF